MTESLEKLKAYLDKKLNAEDFWEAAELLEEVAETHLELPLDADGVPIRPNDDLYEISTGKLIDGKYVYGVSEYRVYIFRIKELGVSYSRVVGELPKCFTHRKPDTWEQIIEDARACLMSDYKTEATPTMRWKLDNADLVARCKALAGEGA